MPNYHRQPRSTPLLADLVVDILVIHHLQTLVSRFAHQESDAALARAPWVDGRSGATTPRREC